MKQAGSLVLWPLRLIAVAVCMACLPAVADEYSEVSQLARSGKLAEAMSRADQFLASQPKDPQMRFIKGVIQRDSGKTAEAIATFTRLTEDYPELPEPYNNLAVLYAGQSQFDKARVALEAAIRTNPSYATAHENLGDIYAKLASQAYSKALQLDTANQAVQPKVNLIREIFNGKNARTAVAIAPPVPTATVPSSASKPAPAPTPTAPSPPPTAVATPPKPATPPPAPVAEASNLAKEAEAAVASWASAWSARDVKAYLASYGKDFDPPGALSRQAWEEERRQRIISKPSISVKVDNLRVSVNGNRATARFRQDYKAGGLAVASNKTLDLAKVGEQWLIVKETVGN